MYMKEKTHYAKCPPSILRKRPPFNQDLSKTRKAERRVRFQEPEEIIRRARQRTANTMPLFLWIFLCLALFLALSLYCSSVRQDFKVLEDFRSQLVIAFLQIRHVALKCWTWFTSQ
ncbi:nutritionally-regulated adipose and cardiac enriched protein homolog [Pogona vitticeps]|uniref:Nutritionally-regulated adipose and cardiac enriched protein homolog n=1 Tax=Pogona vitticeps TaxID=103695 RepID=A0ABM5FBR3_9SAUR|nr:nutritionally-regulated adipose and cardiac enriched protein homolog [Pogona vitticeps]